MTVKSKLKLLKINLIKERIDMQFLNELLAFIFSIAGLVVTLFVNWSKLILLNEHELLLRMLVWVAVCAIVTVGVTSFFSSPFVILIARPLVISIVTYVIVSFFYRKISS